MTNLIYACWRKDGAALDLEAMGAVADRISPLGPGGPAHQHAEGPQERLCLARPARAVAMQGTSTYLGALSGRWPDWARPKTAVPDGAFALLRTDAETVEVCSDFAGSRTLWYVHTPERLLVSTSPRALVALLSSFEFNRSAFGWFLSSGSQGPSDGWDLRLKRLPPNARLQLHRATWELSVQSQAPAFAPEPMDPAACRSELEGALHAALSSYDFTTGNWAFPLSGGYDCRYILTALHAQGLRPRTVTWGLAASLAQPGNDAYVAQQLARHYDLPHDYLLTERSSDAPEAVVDRFLQASGGATDQLFPYLDGMRLWDTLATQGVDGVIRGDEGFGWIPVKTDLHARTSVGLMLLRDFLDEGTAEALAGGPQVLPEAFGRRADESLPSYRDRLYHAFRIPVGLAALNDVKTSYVEIASPLLSRPILAFVRRMPDALRTDKGLFRAIAKAASPAIPYATMNADDDREDYLWSEAYVRWFEAELEGDIAPRLLPEGFRRSLREDLHRAPSAVTPSRSLRAALKRIIPTSWVRAVRAQMGAQLPPRRLLMLRTALACRTLRMYEADARVLAPSVGAHG